jgi:hypothetical protein
MAWLTNLAILTALATAERAAIVVQKEDFLRRDVGVTSFPKWRDKLHQLYDDLKPFEPEDFVETFPGQQEGDPDFNGAAQSRLFDTSGMYRHGRDHSSGQGSRRSVGTRLIICKGGRLEPVIAEKRQAARRREAQTGEIFETTVGSRASR